MCLFTEDFKPKTRYPFQHAYRNGLILVRKYHCRKELGALFRLSVSQNRTRRQLYCSYMCIRQRSCESNQLFQSRLVRDIWGHVWTLNAHKTYVLRKRKRRRSEKGTQQAASHSQTALSLFIRDCPASQASYIASSLGRECLYIRTDSLLLQASAGAVLLLKMSALVNSEISRLAPSVQALNTLQALKQLDSLVEISVHMTDD